eukprot:s96_g19.t1
MIQLALPLDHPEMQWECRSGVQRWCRSPFTMKPSILKAFADMPLMQLAASFVSHTKLEISMTCHVNGKLVDPTLPVSHFPPDLVVSFKIAPLLGGAKKGAHEAVKSRVVTALENHGVPRENSSDRAASFLQKADVETIAKCEAGDDEAFWKAVKEEANRVHFRLVFRSEMQQARKDNRRKPADKPAKKPRVENKGNFVASAANVVIDMKHFWDGDDNVEKIECSRFGPDQTGVAVMSFDEAERHMSGASISVDALAILVVGRKFSLHDTPFAMPAHTVQGEPIIIQAALRQFGDRPVVFKAAVPDTKVCSSASTVVELRIVRAEVSAWRECSVPLHYLGVHISAVRGSNLIATWSLKTWKDARQPSSFQEAQYWHGYVRISDEILDQVLARSGFAGIYVDAKDANKRHDERFAVIAVPNSSLQEIQKKASTQEKALGIVKLRDQYGIRCRREHAAVLRATLLPESAFVASDGITEGDTLWVLKHIPQEVGKDGLQNALTQAQWDAHPIRAQGQDRWLVASKTEPYSRHLCINGTYVLIEPVRKQKDQSMIITARQVQVDTVVTSATEGMQVASSTRIREVRAEISEQMEQKLQAANNKINELSNALEQFQQSQIQKDNETKSELIAMRNEQAFAKQKIGEVEASVVQSGQTVIQTMQQMMAQMQQSLETSMKSYLAKDQNEECKRPRSDNGQNGQKDAFSTKA